MNYSHSTSKCSSGGAIDDINLPTPPSETVLPARQATVYVPTPVHAAALAYAKERFGRVIPCDELGLEDGLRVADGLLNRANPLPADVLRSAPKLAAVSVVGVGTDSIDLSTCRERGVAVLNCPGSNAQPVAELTLALILALLRKIASLDRRLRSGERVLSIHNLGNGLQGRAVGLVGMGATARRVGEILFHAFGCPIHVYSPTSPRTRWTAHDPSGPLPHTRHDALSTLLPSVDILCLHCPLTPDTRNLISTPELRAMRDGAVLVNMSRGAVVDEPALAAALKRNLGGAASDVFEVEPAHRDSMNGLIDYWALAIVRYDYVAGGGIELISAHADTPSSGGSTVEAQIDVCLLAIDQLADYFDGYQIRNRVC